MFGREGRIRLFLGFLIFVLVLVNSQSLMLSSRSREQLETMFDGAAKSSAERLAAELNEGAAGGLSELGRRLADVDRAEFASICLLDWEARLVTDARCPPAEGGAFDRLDRDGRRRLLEEGFAMTRVAPAYDVSEASAFGYLVLGDRRITGGGPGVLRVEVPAPTLAEANRRFRTILVYQISALSLVLLALVLFFQSSLAPHRRLVAEARSVASELSEEPEFRDESQFLLETFQQVVARLKKKEEELSALHRFEKARADETEALASDIIRSMTTGLVSLDPSGRVAVVNPAAESIFGVSAPDSLGRPLGEVFPGSDELDRLVKEALEHGVYHLRGRVRYRKQAATLHLGVSVIPLKRGEDAPRGALCLVADLSEIVELRERLFLKENLARLGEMAAGIAHEFRNGLATILGNARLLRDGSEGEAAELADAVTEEGQSLARVVSEFLQFARPEPLHPNRIHLRALLRDLLDELEPRAHEASVAVALEGDDAALEGDESLLRKAFSNLVVNAVEAISEEGGDGGRVVVEIRRQEDAVLVRVKDDGPGIDPADRARIFNPFFTRKQAGTGLGLSVVQKIVVSHNGTVEVEDASRGACFLVRLPLESVDLEHPEAWV